MTEHTGARPPTTARIQSVDRAIDLLLAVAAAVPTSRDRARAGAGVQPQPGHGLAAVEDAAGPRHGGGRRDDRAVLARADRGRARGARRDPIP